MEFDLPSKCAFSPFPEILKAVFPSILPSCCFFSSKALPSFSLFTLLLRLGPNFPFHPTKQTSSFPKSPLLLSQSDPQTYANWAKSWRRVKFTYMANTSVPSFEALLSSGLFPLHPDWLKCECERLSVQNLALSMTISQLASECKQVEAKLEAGLLRRRQRRNRRLAAQIPRYFQCEMCEKSYGSSAALTHHCLSKHS